MNRRVMRLAVLGFVVGDVDHNGRLIKEELVTVPLHLLWPFDIDVRRVVEEVESQLNTVPVTAT